MTPVVRNSRIAGETVAVPVTGAAAADRRGGTADANMTPVKFPAR
jgi:hypothetical protein